MAAAKLLVTYVAYYGKEPKIPSSELLGVYATDKDVIAAIEKHGEDICDYTVITLGDASPYQIRKVHVDLSVLRTAKWKT